MSIEETGEAGRPAQQHLSEEAPHRPWIEHYPPGMRWNTELRIEPVVEQILTACDKYPERPALDFLGATTTYAELKTQINALTGAIQAELGVEKGTRVALLLPNTPYYVYLYYAVLQAGGTVVNCNPLYSLHELRHIIKDSKAEIIVTLDLKATYDKADALVAETGLNKLVVCRFVPILPRLKSWLFRVLKHGDRADVVGSQSAGSVVWFDQLMAKKYPVQPVAIDANTDVAVQQYTGGTTGIPKGAMLSHANVAAQLAQIDTWSDNEYAPEHKLVAVLPFFHIFSMTTCLNNTLMRGMELLMLPRMEMKTFLDLIARKRPEHLMAVPSLLSAIASHRLTANYDLTCIRYCVVGGAAAAVETRKSFGDITGARMIEGYGLTEASPVVSCQPFRTEAAEGSVGMPFPGTDIRIVSVNDPYEDMPLGERGEILVKGPQVMLGYFGHEDSDDTGFIDGWLRTGDVGYLDETGSLFLVDRIKDLIICSGFNVYPRSIEDALYHHPMVEEVNVIGVPDERRGEAPIAYVKLHEDAEVTRQVLTEHLRKYLSKIQMPREIIFVEELPKTLVGKLSKNELREDYEQRRKANEQA